MKMGLKIFGSSEMIFVDRTNRFMVGMFRYYSVCGDMGWSAMKMLKRRGTDIAPCGTPAFIVDLDDKLVR